jgi:hypothetical protein
MKSNQEIIEEAQRKKEAMNRVNNKYASDLAQKNASELHDMKLVMPSSKVPSTKPSSLPSQRESSYEEEELIPVSQKQLDDDEFAELLNGGDMIQPKWNIDSNLTGRETQFVPTYEENKDDDDENDYFKVQYDRDSSPYNNKMRTIKEEDEDRRSNGSDTAYFSPDNEDDFNNRDDQYDSEEEKQYEKRR